MRIVAKSALVKFWRAHPDFEEPLKAWYAYVKKANWTRSQDVKDDLANARPIRNGRVVFDIKGNTYRLIVAFDYVRGVDFIKFIGTHAEYDKIDPETVDRRP